MSRLRTVGRACLVMGVLMIFSYPSAGQGAAGPLRADGLRDAGAAAGTLASPGSDAPHAPGLGDSGWLGTISVKIRQSEYAFSMSAGGAWLAPNRAHDLRTRVAAAGIEMTSRTRGADEEDGGWEIRLGMTAVGRPGHMAAPGRARPRKEGDGVEFRGRNLTESLLNGEQGLVQRSTVQARPAGGAPDAPLILEQRFSGGLTASAGADGQSIAFRSGAGAEAVNLSGLSVSDARGHELAASFVVLRKRIQVVIQDQDAAYPLTVSRSITSPSWQDRGSAGPLANPLVPDNPLTSLPSWTTESNQAGALLHVAETAGDVNGDGFSDVIVGAQYFDNGQTDEGRAFLYFGSPSGLATTPDWTAESERPFSQFGYSVATAGDVNGDGFSDVIVGAAAFDNGQTDEGRAYLYLGSPAGLAASPVWTAESDQAAAFFGFSVSAAGDVNGDGFSDVIVGAVLYDNGQADEGRVFLYLGSPDGLASFPVWTAESNWSVPPLASAVFGWSVSTAGDVNDDGYSDIIVGCMNYSVPGEPDYTGAAFAWHGGPSSAGDPSGLGPDGTPDNADWTAHGPSPPIHFGSEVATAGDVNGDGYSDVIVGASGDGWAVPHDPNAIGQALAFLGSASGLATTAAWTVVSDQPGATLGVRVRAAGDVNGDGLSDVIVSSRLYDYALTDMGRADVYLGSPSGLDMLPTWTAAGEQANEWFGNRVASAGDVNGDGFSDVIVSAALYDNGQTNEGRALLFHGGAHAARIQGTAFDDFNADGYLDPGEPGIPNRIVQAVPAAGGQVSANIVGASDTTTVVTDSQGRFEALVRPGSYVLRATTKNGENWSLATLPVTVDANETLPGNDVGRGLTRDVGVSLFPQYPRPLRAPCPAQLMDFCVVYRNLGSVNESLGEVTLQLPPASQVTYQGFTISNCNAPPASTPVIEGDNLLTWRAQPPFQPYQSCTLCASVLVGDSPAVELGDYLSATATIFLDRGHSEQDSITAGDSANETTTGILVSCARDPNELRVTPPGCGASALIRPGETLTYLVQFQNLGNAPATDVIIRDFLDPGLDVASLQMIDTSHPLTSVSLGGNNLLIWSFVDINLPDAATDEPGSHGFVLFRAKVRPGLPEGTVIANRASIVFDLNAPVVTNEVVNVITNNSIPPLGEPVAEACNAVDDDCDGTVDGFGTSCGVGECAGTGLCTAGSDSCTPGAPSPEVCDGLDNDCNGTVDDGFVTMYFRDADGDTYGDQEDNIQTCVQPAGYVPDSSDCLDADPMVWGTPGEAADLLIQGDGQTITWQAASPPGGAAVAYDVLRVTDTPGDFLTAAACVEFDDGTDTLAVDQEVPPIGAVFNYLVRAENGCPGALGMGSLGSTSDGTPRAGRSCP